MDMLKEAFFKIKEDIDSLKKEIILLKDELNYIKSFSNLNSNHVNSTENKTIPTNYLLDDSSFSNSQTIQQSKNEGLEGLKDDNSYFSTGNEGVPTNRQTDKQTDISSLNLADLKEKDVSLDFLSNFEKAQMIISSLDNIKKDIRKTFKNLTPQEMLVFSTLYSYEDQKYENINYKLISDKLNLSESSIRDYINKLIKKGIPIDKRRLNNKKIILSIAPNLKEITNLSTIIKLRNL